MEDSHKELHVAIGVTHRMTEQVKNVKEVDRTVPIQNHDMVATLSRAVMVLELDGEK